MFPRNYSDTGLNTHFRNCFILAGPGIEGPNVQTSAFPFFSIPFGADRLYFYLFTYSFLTQNSSL